MKRDVIPSLSRSQQRPRQGPVCRFICGPAPRVDPPRIFSRMMLRPRPQCHQRCVVPHPPFVRLVNTLTLHARAYSCILTHTHTHTHTHNMRTHQYRHRHSSLRCTVASPRMAAATCTRAFRTLACTRSLQPAPGQYTCTLRFLP